MIDEILCDYGCGQKATHTFKNGKNCCCYFTTKCPSLRNINSIKNTKENNAFYGRKHSDETRKLMSINWRKGPILKPEKTKYIFTEEHKRKISESRKGIKFSEEHRQKLSKAKIGKEPSNKGKPKTKEMLQKMSDVMKGKLAGDKHPMWGKHCTEEMKINGEHIEPPGYTTL